MEGAAFAVAASVALVACHHPAVEQLMTSAASAKLHERPSLAIGLHATCPPGSYLADGCARARAAIGAPADARCDAFELLIGGAVY